jgi:hypothetical protein
LPNSFRYVNSRMLSQRTRQGLSCMVWILLLCADLHAQPDDPNGGERPARQVPIKGIEVILVAGGIWGAKKILDLSRRK